MNKLTPNQLALLSEILTQHCEDCDTSKTTAYLVDNIWEKIYTQNKTKQPIQAEQSARTDAWIKQANQNIREGRA